MKDLDKKSNTELLKLKHDLSEEFEKVKIDVVKVYDYWKFVEEQYHDVNNEIRKRNI